MEYAIIEKHISKINAGDTILHEGVILTACQSDIKSGGFMGTTIFGDSYRCGYKMVQVLDIKHARAA